VYNILKVGQNWGYGKESNFEDDLSVFRTLQKSITQSGASILGGGVGEQSPTFFKVGG